MTQFPSPYAAPSYYPGPPVNPSSANRRASVMMFVLGGLYTLLGGCIALGGLFLGAAPASPQRDQLESQLAASGIPPQAAPAILVVSGAMGLALGVTLLALALFVRRNRRGATIAATIVTGLTLLYLLVSLVVGVLRSGGNPNAVGGACLSGLLMAAFGLQLAWLVAALRASPNAAAAQHQYAAQYWQYQQAMQAYAAQPQPGHGYPTTSSGYALQPPPPPVDAPPQAYLEPPPPPPDHGGTSGPAI